MKIRKLKDKNFILKTSVVAKEALMEVVKNNLPPTPLIYDYFFRKIADQKKTLPNWEEVETSLLPGYQKPEIPARGKYREGIFKPLAKDEEEKDIEIEITEKTKALNVINRALMNISSLSLQIAGENLQYEDAEDLINIITECIEEIGFASEPEDFVSVLQKLGESAKLSGQKNAGPINSRELEVVGQDRDISLMKEIEKYRHQALEMDRELEELKSISDLLLSASGKKLLHHSFCQEYSIPTLEAIKTEIKNFILHDEFEIKNAQDWFREISSIALQFAGQISKSNKDFQQIILELNNKISQDDFLEYRGFIDELKGILEDIVKLLGKMEQQKKELKEIITALMETITSVGSTSSDFGKKLSSFQVQLQSAEHLEDIVSIKKAIIFATSNIQMATTKSTKKFNQASLSLDRASEAIEHFEKEISQTRHITYIDPLTGLPNRRAVTPRLSDEVVNWRSGKGTGSLIMFAIDHFKEVSKIFGFSIADKFLQEMVNRSEGALDGNDYFTRYGSDIFCIILPDQSIEQGLIKAEKLLRVIGDTPFSSNEKSTTLSISLGIASYRDGDNSKSLFGRVEQALENAKTRGGGAISVESD